MASLSTGKRLEQSCDLQRPHPKERMDQGWLLAKWFLMEKTGKAGSSLPIASGMWSALCLRDKGAIWGQLELQFWSEFLFRFNTVTLGFLWCMSLKAKIASFNLLWPSQGARDRLRSKEDSGKEKRVQETVELLWFSRTSATEKKRKQEIRVKRKARSYPLK